MDREIEWSPGDGDGQGGLACCDSWGRKESDTTERLNWTELNPNFIEYVRNFFFPSSFFGNLWKIGVIFSFKYIVEFPSNLELGLLWGKFLVINSISWDKFWFYVSSCINISNFFQRNLPILAMFSNVLQANVHSAFSYSFLYALFYYPVVIWVSLY